MYEQEMLGYLFEAYREKGLNLWRLPTLSFMRMNGGLDLDAIVKGTPVQELMAGNVYLAVPLNHGKHSVEEAIRRLFVQISGFDVAMYTFAIRDGVIATENNGVPLLFTYLEFINAVEKLPNMNGIK